MERIDLLYIIYLLCPMTLGLILTEIGTLRYSKPMTFLLVSGIISLYVTVMWPVWNESMLARTVLYPAVLLGVIWLVLRETPKRKLLILGMYYLITLFADLAVTCFGFLFLQRESIYVVEGSMANYLCAALSPVFMMSFSTIAVSCFNNMEKGLRRRIAGLMLLLLLSQCMFTVAIARQSGAITEKGVVVYAIVCECLCIVVQYIAFETINRSVAAVRDRLELEHLRKKQELDQKYVQTAQENAEEMAAFRHDFKNQLQVAYALLEHEPEQAAVFLKELEQKLERAETSCAVIESGKSSEI